MASPMTFATEVVRTTAAPGTRSGASFWIRKYGPRALMANNSS